jgi:uncharacterized membrane protein YGL010W
MKIMYAELTSSLNYPPNHIVNVGPFSIFIPRLLVAFQLEFPCIQLHVKKSSIMLCVPLLIAIVLIYFYSRFFLMARISLQRSNIWS